MIKELPDIATSANFWAATATLWSAAGAWFTYVATAIASRQQTQEGVMNLVAGIEVELDLIAGWASGGEGDQGYLLAKTDQDWMKEKPDWFNPSRQIFTFETPTLDTFTTSPYLRHLTPIVRPLIQLNHSITRLFEYHNEYRAFAHSEPALYRGIVKKMSEGANIFTNEEKAYMFAVFGMNLKMHRDLIGGVDSSERLGLYWAFRNAQTALTEFKKNFRREQLPWWYWILHILASYLALNGMWQVARWFDML